MTTDLSSQLSVAFDVTGELIGSVADAQWTAPTPCSQWCVRDLVRHLVAGNILFADALRGLEPARAIQPPPDDGDWLKAYQSTAAELLDAFGQPGALDRIVSVPFGSVPGIVALHLRITEVLVHGWDLARATGQHAVFPEALAEQELAFSQSKLSDIPPDRRPFAPPQQVSGDAPAIDRLAACLGRKVE